MSNEGWTETQDFGDWDSVSTEGPKPLPKGVYLAKIGEAKAEKTEKGKPAIKMVFTVLAERGGEALKIPRKVKETITLEESTRFKLKGLCQAVGVDCPKTNGYNEIAPFASDLVGREVIVALKLDSFKGRDGEDVTINRVNACLTEAEADARQNPGAKVEQDAAAAVPRTARARRAV